WLATAAALSVPPRAMFAESDLAPMLPEHVTLLITPEQFILRDGRSRPVVFPADDPEFALLMLLGADKDLSQVNLVVHAAVEDWPAHEPAIEALRPRLGSLHVQLATGGLLALLAQGISGSPPANLLQGALKPHTPCENQCLRSRPAA